MTSFTLYLPRKQLMVPKNLVVRTPFLFYENKYFHFRVRIAKQLHAHKRLWYKHCKHVLTNIFAYLFFIVNPNNACVRTITSPSLSVPNLLLYTMTNSNCDVTLHQDLNETYNGSINMNFITIDLYY